MFLKTFSRRITIKSEKSWAQRNPIISNDKKEATPLGIILAMVQLKRIRDAEGKNDITFAAGLPDGEVPEEIKAELQKMSTMKTSPYLQYDLTSEYNIDRLSTKISDFHKSKFHTNFLATQIRFTAGSTPIIHAVAAITQYPGSKAVVIKPGYPLYDLPVEMYGGSINKDAKLITDLERQNKDNFFNTENRWNINYTSLKNSLQEVKPSLIYLNFPGNPTGYSPTANESRKIVKILLEHIQFCWSAGIRAPLILEDIAYATMMHDSKKFYGLHNSISDLYTHASLVEKKLLHELEQSLVVVHSFSKAFSIAGDRVGYFATLNSHLYNEISNKMTIVDLTFGRGGLAAMTGALKAGDVNSENMLEYQGRLRHFENEINNIVNEWGKKNNINDKTLKKLLPMQARADAGFFSLTFFNLLKDHEVSKEIIENINNQISQLSETSKAEFLNIFENGKINNALDAALWLAEKAGVITVPISDQNNIMLRFSVGQTPFSLINEGLSRIHHAIQEISPLVAAVDTNQHCQQELTVIDTHSSNKTQAGENSDPISIEAITRR